MSDGSLLTYQELELAKAIFLQSVEVELDRLDSNANVYIKARLDQDISVLKLHTLLRPDVIKTLSLSIFDNPDFADFILNLTDRFYCLTGVTEFANNKIAMTIANFCNSGKPPGNENPDLAPNSFIPQRVADNLALDKDAAMEIFISNRHYLVIAMLVLFVHETSAMTRKESKPDPKKK